MAYPIGIFFKHYKRVANFCYSFPYTRKLDF